jgi:hypothetical protein
VGLQARAFENEAGRGYALLMRPFILGMLICIYTGFVSAQSNIRQVDFKNFTYPLSGPLLGHRAMSWLGDPKGKYSKRSPVHLLHGKDASGFTFESVRYADVIGDGKEDAIVVLTYHTGGTQTTNYVYIYSLQSRKPKLLDFCFTGDRADSGLYKVYGENGKLIFDRFDPELSSGDCCSSGFVETQYRWDGVRFVRVGPVTRGAVK